MQIEKNKIYNMDCLEGMKHIPDQSIDMILCDLPYGVSGCEWDKVINIEALWLEYERIIQDKAAIVLTSQQPFTTDLIVSNRTLFKYSFVWVKNKTTGFAHAKNKPLRAHEDILVFSKGVINHVGLSKKRMIYYPQGLTKCYKKCTDSKKSRAGFPERPSHGAYIREYENYPKSILTFACSTHGYHQTEKPVALFEYLIKTYTQEGATVLDNCMGSGTTAIACLNTNRNFTGFETEPKYFDIANQRIQEHVKQQAA